MRVAIASAQHHRLPASPGPGPDGCADCTGVRHRGWYSAGPEPGEPGPAVIAGHLDSKTGPDVFARLSQARPGQRIRIDLEDGTTLIFRVTDVEQYAQTDFPTRSVYGATDDPELRLITCGGAYDHAVGRYQDNVVVFAELAS